MSGEFLRRQADAFDQQCAVAREAGEEMMRLAERLFPIARSLTGPGVRQTLDILGEFMPLHRRRVASGTRCFDWIVPMEWTVREAFVEFDGARLVDFADNNLHLVGYSTPVDADIDLDELRAHLHSLPERPTAVPYRTSYYQESWGFCIAHDQLRTLCAGRYRVRIDSELRPGHLDFAVGNAGAPLGSPEVLFTSYVCHPSMANNELSGPILLAFLHRALSRIPGLRYRYVFVLAPETIGSLAFLSEEGQRLKTSLKAGYICTCIGDDGPFTYKRSRAGSTLADRAAVHALEYMRGDRPLRLMDFDPSDGSDERQYCSPGFDLPVGNLARSIYASYPEYHTSLDDLNLISDKALGASLEACLRVVQTIELAVSLVRSEPHGEPQLGRRGLYPALGGADQLERETARLLYLLNYSDGNCDLLAIADRLREPVWLLARPAATLLDAGLITPPSA